MSSKFYYFGGGYSSAQYTIIFFKFKLLNNIFKEINNSELN